MSDRLFNNIGRYPLGMWLMLDPHTGQPEPHRPISTTELANLLEGKKRIIPPSLSSRFGEDGTLLVFSRAKDAWVPIVRLVQKGELQLDHGDLEELLDADTDEKMSDFVRSMVDRYGP